MTDLTAVADALALDPEAPMDLGVLLGFAEGNETRIQQLFNEAPEIFEGATKGEYAVKIRLYLLRRTR
ncbi:hypothetical protein OG311_13460 [Streptomyces sp. NBC_01343]|uniref:hypothetical protein n=1 Tax=Streptomyces sp. NBC_01343 TaxID=2903832 RepID=UPI002E10DE3D|nr:hypothetical protein OG311_13460 [Streptomyces sp. NBC_01343]